MAVHQVIQQGWMAGVLALGGCLVATGCCQDPPQSAPPLAFDRELSYFDTILDSEARAIKRHTESREVEVSLRENIQQQPGVKSCRVGVKGDEYFYSHLSFKTPRHYLDSGEFGCVVRISFLTDTSETVGWQHLDRAAVAAGFTVTRETVPIASGSEWGAYVIVNNNKITSPPDTSTR